MMRFSTMKVVASGAAFVASIALTAAVGTTLAPSAQSDGPPSDFWSQVVRAELDRWPADAPSNSGHTVDDECGPDGADAEARMTITQTGSGSRVTITVQRAKPETLYTVWVRLRGSGPDGTTIGPNPMSGGGATALLPGTGLDTALGQSPPFDGTPDPLNGFTTDRRGNARWTIDLDFPVIGGSYPFQRASEDAVQALADAGSGWPLVRVPAPIVDPTDPAIDGPFLIRVVSHCQDGLGHGLSPAARETWFQYP